MRRNRRDDQELALNIVNVSSSNDLSSRVLFLHAVCEGRSTFARRSLIYELLVPKVRMESKSFVDNLEVFGDKLVAL
jgi:hypothetical protein